MRLFKPSKPNIDTVYLRYADMLYRLAFARLANDADAQDVVQDVFTSYISAQPLFEDVEHEKAWFLRTALNRCYDITRRQKIRAALPLEEALGVAAQQENLMDIIDLLEQLPPMYKDTVILYALEGFSLEETARILEISLSAVKMRVLRSRKILNVLREEEHDV